MPCYHPIDAYKSRFINPATGKHVIKFNIPYSESLMWEPVQLPCGQCVGCRLEYSRQWANRCMLELEDHDSAFFCTFTYDNDHAPVSYYSDPSTGEAIPVLTLRKRDMQLLLKRIRKHFPDDKIRFFGCGEYGGQTLRPHYHIILYGLHLNDLVKYKTVREGGVLYTYYNSDSLQSCWLDSSGNPMGYVVVGDVTWESCAYTARYVMKKLKGTLSEYYEFYNIEPEFTLMSRRPGIARNYYESHPDIYNFDYINISTKKGGKKFRPPKYFDRLFEVDEPDRFADIKEKRKGAAVNAANARLAKTSLERDELLAVQEAALSNKIKTLRRNL